MRPYGYQRTPFTRQMWDRWLTHLNTAENRRGEGVAEMRCLLQSRCLGALTDSVESTATYRVFVERQFGSVK